MVRKLSLLWLFLVLALASVQAQFNLNEFVPVDPAVRIGTLDNGLTYYIRANKEPKERASFFMIQNVGALLEEDNQNGLAHFLEHMAFNGTQHFEGKGILNTLQRYGVAFGRNINASTSYQQTVYYLSDVPVAAPRLLDSCLLILNDWSHYLQLSDKEIDLERGVVSEEWRTGRDASFRMLKQFMPVLMKGSKYAVRDVIGDINIIKNFKYDDLRSFYHSWYRTDLQAIAIVGDFDAGEMEAKVKTLFSTIPAVSNPMKREKYPVPTHTEPYYVLATDKEAPQSGVSILIMRPNRDEQKMTWNDVRQNTIQALYNNMLSVRIQELMQKGNPPFVSGSSGISSYVRGYDVYAIETTAKPNEESRALEAIWTETERVRRYGFTATELERAKTNMLTQWDSRYKQRDKISSISFCSEYSDHYLTAGAIPGIDAEYAFAKQVIPTITTQELLAAARSWITQENRVIVVEGPSEGVTHITEPEALAVLDKVEKMELKPYVDGVTSTTLISEPLKGGQIISTKKIPALNAVEWTLSNHAKVLYRHADYEKDQVQLQAFSLGGLSRVELSDLPAATVDETFLPYYGLGDFDMMTLQKMLTGKNVSLAPFMGEIREGYRGSSTPKDFETLMQLLYLFFEKPRYDKEVYDALMSRMKASMANRDKDPASIMSDSILVIMASHNPRVQPVDTTYLSKATFDKIKTVNGDRFQDAGDFTFVIVGNIAQDSVKNLVTKYIGSLKDKPRTESWVDRKVRSPKGKTTRELELNMTTPKTTVRINYSADMKYTPRNIMLNEILTGILALRYTEVIRENEGGTYGVRVSASLSQYPIARESMTITFDCEPSRAAHLKTLVYQQIDSLMSQGPSKVDFDKTIQNMKKDRQQAKEHNSFWMNALHGLYYNGFNSASPDYFENIIQKLTREDVQKQAKEFFTQADVVDLVFKPKQ